MAWRPVPAWARVMLITFWVSSKLTPLVWVQVRSRPNCLMKLASSSASRVTNSAQLRVRRRRTGWLDTVAVRRAVQLNSLSGFCLTKLDVLDGLKEVKLCVAYRMPDGREVTTTPLAADDWKGVEPIYETMPGWSESTFGVKDRSGLPQAALNYIKRIEELTGVPDRYHLYRSGSY